MERLEDAFRRIERHARRYVRTRKVPGLVLAITDRARVIRLAALGYADLAARRRLVPEDRFEIGSISKSFTAIALLQEWEAGRVDLDALVRDYLPWFDVRSPRAPITVHHLLTHTSGIILGTEATLEARREVWSLREMETGFPPGERFHYSNVGYKTLGLVLEAITGQTCSETVRRRILDPLEMSSSDTVVTHDGYRNLAVGYQELHDDRPMHPDHPLIPATWFETATADGSIVSTAADMAAYVRMVMNRGEGPSGRILSERAFDRFTHRAFELEDGTAYGYGLNIVERDGHTVVGHTGGMVGYDTSILADLDAGLGAVLLSNSTRDVAPVAELAMRVLHAAADGRPWPAEVPLGARVKTPNPEQYVGVYGSTAKRLSIHTEGGRLVLETDGSRVPLEPRGPDTFYAPHPSFDRFLLRFGRQGGAVVEAFHGPDWHPADRYEGPRAFTVPEAWTAFPGHYRSHNPWLSNFRVVLRKGTLSFIRPDGGEEPLAPLGNGRFRAGSEPSPERIRFDTVIEGEATRANLSGCDYYRTFTP